MLGTHTARSRVVLLVAMLAACDATPAAVSSSAPAPVGSADAAPAPAHVSERVRLTGGAMGTSVELVAFTTRDVDAVATQAALRAAIAEVRRLEHRMSPWVPRSDVAQVNAAAGGAAVKVSAETLEVIRKSLWISEQSDGVFDVTFASMGGLWRFRTGDTPATVPTSEEVALARKRIDYRSVEVDTEAGTVRLARADQRIDLGGIAKGYAIDRAAAVLRAAGLTSFWAKAGGDLYVAGTKPNGVPVRAGIRDPRGAKDDDFARVDVIDHAFSTAGDYERTFVKNAKRYHHIIDPRTGYPATASRSVTIWAKDALTADAIDDAVFILGPKRGLALVESIPDCGAVIVDADNRVWISDRLEGKVELVHAPSDAL